MTALLRLPVALRRYIRLPDRKASCASCRSSMRLPLSPESSFRVTKSPVPARSAIIRDSDIEVEEESEDLVQLFETALKRRPARFGSSASSSTARCPKRCENRRRRNRRGVLAEISVINGRWR